LNFEIEAFSNCFLKIAIVKRIIDWFQSIIVEFGIELEIEVTDNIAI
jgi:hypothetical protein